MHVEHPKIAREQEEQVPPVFSARLSPHRSLGKTGFVVLMAFVAVSCFTSGIFFMIAGAWPVMVTLGLDVIAIWVAFKLNFRSAREYEEVEIWPDKLVVRKTSPSGKSKEYLFNPFWVKFLVDRHREFGINAMKLVEKGRELPLGSFLNPDDRVSFASAFTAALADAKR